MNPKGMRITHEEDRVRCRAVPSVRGQLALVMESTIRGLPVPILLSAAFPSRLGELMHAMPVTARIYVAAVLAAACAFIAAATTQLPTDRIDEVVILAALYVLSESLSARGSRDMLSI